MKNRTWLVPLIILLCLAPACRKTAPEPAKEAAPGLEADEAAIRAQFDEFVQLYNAGDIDGIVSRFYAEDAVQMPPSEPARKGKEAIRLGYHKTRELNDESIDSSILESVRVSGDIAFVWGMDMGTTTPRNGGEPARYRLKWLTVLERSRADGSWKWVCEIWNEAGPPPALPPDKR